MRLYKLMRRVGNKTSSVLPWPEDPLAVSPGEFAGWRWDDQRFEWVKVPMAPIQLKAPPPVYDKPLYSPREEIPYRVPGWQWSDSMREWAEVSMPMERVQREMQRPPMPEFSPGAVIPERMPGWQWSDSMQDWLEAPLLKAGVQREMTRPPAPLYMPWDHRNITYRCWKWLTRWRRWKHTPLTEMEKARGLECDPQPEYEPRAGQKPVVEGWMWSAIGKRWIESPMPLEWVEVEVERPPRPQEKPRSEMPWRVDGWVWSTTRRKWIETPMPLEWVEVEAERPPRPAEAPREADPTRVPGWVWHPQEKEWAEIIYAEEVMEFDMPHSLPPGVTQAMVENVYPYADVARKAAEMFSHMGLPPELAHQYGVTVIEMIRQKVIAASQANQAVRWQDMATAVRDHYPGDIAQFTMPVVIAIVALITLYVVAKITAALVWPERDSVFMTPALRTYLMGPDDWLYAGCVGVSVKEVPYYKACSGIGATNAHHLRGSFGALDRIAFTPGGFLETGYKIPRWVAYRWEYWEIQYIGFLVRTGANLYRLQEGSHDPEQAGYARLYPPEQVCLNFTYYL